ncbi:hypothetical protein ACJIZ3_013247 [Penstemon smallii]|uniref:Protein WUSCHEL n=1 Tax=Penstemon smallii TaxID=265156 RepID=A0ABD3USU1_9LAMI
MGSSNNRHWPSMFKSKPHISSTTISNTSSSHQQQQWQHHHHHHHHQDTINSSFHRTPYTPPVEERTPEPKPRWNPRPEQIRILESIFNSGMVNPPRDEIRKIRAQLQQYGQVGDANVFYWFQNRKSRTKHKQRQHQHLSKKPISNINITKTSSSSNSSSSDKDNKDKDKDNKHYSYSSPPPTTNQPSFFQASASMAEPFFFPVQQNTTSSAALGGFPPADHTVGVPTFLLITNKPEDDVNVDVDVDVDDQEKMKLQEQLTYGVSAAPYNNNNNNNNNNILLPFPSPTANHVFQGEPAGPTKSTVFINDVCIEVGFGPFNVREAFGDDSVLLQSTGQPVLTNEWGVTLHPLQHGAFYYLVRAFAPSPIDRTIDLI